LISTGLSSVIGLKKTQAGIASDTLKLIEQVQSDEAKAKVAAMAALSAETRSESWLTRTWRPLAFIGFLIMLFAFFFGWAPSNLLKDSLPPLIERIFSIIEIVLLAGYPSRTVEKLVREISLGQILRTIIEKKIL
jgi:hypothetical protein